MYLSLDRESGKMKEWKIPMQFACYGKNGYFTSGGMGGFTMPEQRCGKAVHRIWYAPERRLYSINIDTKEYKEIEISFDYNDLKEHEPGFMEESEWVQYGLNENALNSLKDFLDDNVTGNQFDMEKQRKAFAKINADMDGKCGKRIFCFIRGNT